MKDFIDMNINKQSGFILKWLFGQNRTPVRGFTMIEIMVAIAIIAILTTIGFSAYTQVQMRGRDARRKEDLRAISNALLLYYQVNKRYPCAATSAGLHSTSANWLTDTVTVCGNTGTDAFDTRYISALPVDPIGNTQDYSAASDTYTYFYDTPAVTSGSGSECPALPSGASGNSQYFTLQAHLENPSDPDRCELKKYSICNGTSLCPTGTSNSSQNRIFAVNSQ